MPFAVGLTGGIGSGKTTVANMFACLGAGVVDTDEIAHRLTAPGQPAIAEILEAFGQRVIAKDGSLDRVRMRKLAFANPAARKTLESILHPRIRSETNEQILRSSAPYVLVVVPLLIESGGYRSAVDRVLVVDCEPEYQIQRVMERSGLTRDEVLAIIAAQTSRERRLSEA